MMRAVLRATSTMDQDEQRHFMESNQVEKVLKDALTVVIDECKKRSGSVYTGYLLRAVTSGTGAGPILKEGLETVFAKESLPLGQREEVRTNRRRAGGGSGTALGDGKGVPSGEGIGLPV